MLTGEEIQKLEEFSFGKLLRQIKAERKIMIFTNMRDVNKKNQTL